MKRIFTILLLFSIAFLGMAQESAILVYFDDAYEIQVVDGDGFDYDVFPGMEIEPGWVIKTTYTTAELALDPNGTIIKLSENTEFSIETLQQGDVATDEDQNAFALFGGRIRTVAAKVSGSGYQVRAGSAVCGVRGTDFGMEFNDLTNSVFVKEGQVEFFNDSGKSVFVGAGQVADAFADIFQAASYSSEDFAALYQDLDFKELIVDDVYGQANNPVVETIIEDADDDDADEEDGEDVSDEDSEEGGDDSGLATDPNADGADGESEGSDETAEEENPLMADNPFMNWLRDYMGMEIGAVQIGNSTYSKVVLQPTIEVGDLTAELYLPIIYAGDLFDHNDWYKPKGNNEWSFGSDQNWEGEPLEAVKDVAIDLAMKFKSIKWGETRDPFFFNVGNYDDVTMGHGLIVRDFANDKDFPAVRRLGFHLGVNNEGGSFELLTNDITEPEIFGLRAALNVLGPVDIGLSLVGDIDPAGDLSEGMNPFFDQVIDAAPIFMNVGLDVDIPIVEIDDVFSIVLFADAAAMMPYLRTGVLGLKEGFQLGAVLDEATGQLRNYGVMAGVLGEVLFLKYRVEYRNYTGTFRAGFYDGTYERNRGAYAAQSIAYLLDPNAGDNASTTMGVYGELEAQLPAFLDKISLTGGYFWPWALDANGDIVASDDDYLIISLVIDKGLIPIPPVNGIEVGISYSRTNFVPTLLGKDGFKNANLFDANTVLEGEIIYPLAETLDLAVMIATVVERDGDGKVVYEDGQPKWVPTFTLETRIGF